jgi:hypothetical protein
MLSDHQKEVIQLRIRISLLLQHILHMRRELLEYVDDT